MRKKGKDQMFCKRCNKLTKSSRLMKVDWLSFHVCLGCGLPYEYKSYNTIVNLVGRPKTKRVNGFTKYGKAGTTPGTYKLYLCTNYWKDKRESKLKRNPLCENCMKAKATDVHHLRYQDEGGNSILYKENMKDLLSLCRECHRKVHNINKFSKKNYGEKK